MISLNLEMLKSFADFIYRLSWEVEGDNTTQFISCTSSPKTTREVGSSRLFESFEPSYYQEAGAGGIRHYPSPVLH